MVVAVALAMVGAAGTVVFAAFLTAAVVAEIVPFCSLVEIVSVNVELTSAALGV
ncbi:hypothetical protein SDC9_109030 [bioreactor metagenome]|uniref:Uncharacterized protein n=1 Tax=bioreactor metagenome TaxID=1076179 RepID=A0A645BK61_9ZZZZ